MVCESCIILALDGLTLSQCMALASSLGDRVYAVKIHSFYDEQGPVAVDMLRRCGAKRVWVDAKLLDIPKTVALRARALKEAGADILTVHASGEIDMMMAAVEAGPEEVYAATVLTSLDEDQSHLLHGQPSKAAVLYRARLAKLAGVAGVVCSPKEVGLLHKRHELRGLKFITPGVRSVAQDMHDQERVGTPAGAIIDGATYIVVGRQVTGADDPVAAFDQIEREISLIT